jgi:hypothetical protein
MPDLLFGVRLVPGNSTKPTELPRRGKILAEQYGQNHVELRRSGISSSPRHPVSSEMYIQKFE